MDTQVLQEFLVSLGWKIDTPGLVRLKSTLQDVNKQVEDHTGRITKLFIGMGTGIAATYVAVATATASLMDRVAQSDLGFQLQAMRMMMSTDAAKRLTIATDALGHSLNEIA